MAETQLQEKIHLNVCVQQKPHILTACGNNFFGAAVHCLVTKSTTSQKIILRITLPISAFIYEYQQNFTEVRQY